MRGLEGGRERVRVREKVRGLAGGRKERESELVRGLARGREREREL